MQKTVKFEARGGGGGYINMFEGKGTCHYLGIPFFWKLRNYRYLFLKYVRNYRYHLKKHAELWVSFWENIAKFWDLQMKYMLY